MGEKVIYFARPQEVALFISVINRSTSRDKVKRSKAKMPEGSSGKQSAKKSGSTKKKSEKVQIEISQTSSFLVEDETENFDASIKLLESEANSFDEETVNHKAINSQITTTSPSSEHFYDINLKDVRMRELNLSSDSNDKISAAEKILAVKNSLKKTAIVDPYDLSSNSKELEAQFQEEHEDEEHETMTAAEIALMESIPFSYRSYDELVRLNKEKNYAGLMQRKLEAYLTDEDFEVVFRKNRVFNNSFEHIFSNFN